MDVAPLLESQKSQNSSQVLERAVPFEVDTGLLTVSDLNPVDADAYKSDIEGCLQSTARNGIQALLTAIFQLPTQSSSDGPLALLPAPTTILPRAKPLPKPKTPTKWEKFAAAKGISKTKKDRRVFDEEKQEWVNRWGRDGKNKELESQWLTEVPANADLDFDPAKKARDERKERIAKNEKQRDANLAHAVGHGRRKDIQRTLATTRTSTASLGRFDKKLEGEKKLKGIKRKFPANETSYADERKNALAIVSDLERSGSKKAKTGDDRIVNVRRAVKLATDGRGATSLARKQRKR